MAQEIFQSLSGSEIHAVFGNIKFADIQMIKYASSRQKAPVYTMGSADLRAIARGPRSINGALIFSHLSKQNLVQKMGEAGYKVFLSMMKQLIIMVLTRKMVLQVLMEMLIRLRDRLLELVVPLLITVLYLQQVYLQMLLFSLIRSL